MGMCFCTGRCLEPGGSCAAYPRGNPSGLLKYGTIKITPETEPLTEEDVRRIVREEIRESKGKLA